MKTKHLLQLLLLGAIWGSSFMFMRLAVPHLGPEWLLAIRIASASIMLWLIGLAISKPLRITRHWKHYLFLGLFNTALPFFAFAYAAMTLPASILAILNSTAPFWALLLGFLWKGKPITRRAILGLLLGISGVASLVGLGGVSIDQGALFAVAVTLCASISYGFSSIYAEFAERVEAYANAHGSLWAAAFLLVPFAAMAPAPDPWPLFPTGYALLLGMLCTATAYLLYFHLIATAGAPAAMTVGYLIPLWGVLWGWLFLDEPVGWNTIFGAGLVLTGTVLVTGFTPQVFSRLRKREASIG
ncbi:MAG: DMT family transporter [Pseudomonadota bacterium]